MVHQLVLENDGKDAGLLDEDVRPALRAPLQLGARVAHRVADAVTVGQDAGRGRPRIGRRGAEAVRLHGIDAPLEQLVEGGIEGRPPQHPAADLVPGEGREMP